jgi:hypothetical protein
MRPAQPPHQSAQWRLSVRFAGAGISTSLQARSAAATACRQLSARYTALSDGPWLRLYAPSVDDLIEAREDLGRILVQLHVNAVESAERFDPAASAWSPYEPPPLSSTAQRLMTAHVGIGSWGAEAEPNRVEVRFDATIRAAPRHLQHNSPSAACALTGTLTTSLFSPMTFRAR